MAVMNLSDPETRAKELETEKQILRIRHEAKQAVDAERTASSLEPIKALTIQQLLDRPRPDYLIDQLLPEGALAELVGDSESLKSFIAIHIGMSIACVTRTEFFNLPVVKHGPVLYIAAEGSGAFQFRLLAWGNEHNVDISTVPFFTIAAPVNLRDPNFQEQLLSIVADKKPVLIVVDTLHRCIPGANEDSSSDMGEVVGFATRLIAQSGAAVLFLHHPPKSDPNGRGRGSGSMYYAADTELNSVVEGTPEPGEPKVVKVSVKKQKDDEKVEFLLKTVVVPVLDLRGRPMAYATGRPITSCVLAEASEGERQEASYKDKGKLQQRVLKFVSDHPGQIAEEIRKGVGGKREAVKEALDVLVFDVAVKKDTVKVGRAHRDEYRVSARDESQLDDAPPHGDEDHHA